jgi:COP9 signalosome complex subunit 4
MASSITAQLNSIATSGQQKDRPALYKQFLESLLTLTDNTQALSSHVPNVSPPTTLESALNELLSHAVEESVGLVVSRQLLQDFVTLFQQWAVGKDSEGVMAIWRFALDKMQTRAVAFEEQVEYLYHAYLIRASSGGWDAVPLHT